MIKQLELSDPSSCLNRSQDDEPLFVLCARDQFAPFVVAEWMTRARKAGVNPEKLEEADRLAKSMLDWQLRNFSKLPD